LNRSECEKLAFAAPLALQTPPQLPRFWISSENSEPKNLPDSLEKFLGNLPKLIVVRSVVIEHGAILNRPQSSFKVSYSNKLYGEG